MDNVKPMIASKVIISSLIGGLAALLSLSGVVLSSEQISLLTENVYTGIVVVANLAGIVSFVVSAIARRRSTAQIGGVFTANPSQVPDPAMLMRR